MHLHTASSSLLGNERGGTSVGQVVDGVLLPCILTVDLLLGQGILRVFLGRDGRRIPANAPPSTAWATFDAVDGVAGVIVQTGAQFGEFGGAKRVKRVVAVAATSSGGGGWGSPSLIFVTSQ